jgi:hypothetical protein
VAIVPLHPLSLIVGLAVSSWRQAKSHVNSPGFVPLTPKLARSKLARAYCILASSIILLSHSSNMQQKRCPSYVVLHLLIVIRQPDVQHPRIRLHTPQASAESQSLSCRKAAETVDATGALGWRGRRHAHVTWPRGPPILPSSRPIAAIRRDGSSSRPGRATLLCFAVSRGRLPRVTAAPPHRPLPSPRGRPGPTLHGATACRHVATGSDGDGSKFSAL